ncbi:MAG: EAL domain-containing protein [Candidatus Omnitrophota bacterium]|nr:EAL domain-containing protein [Candidatus Omnitrophota bacterium]
MALSRKQPVKQYQKSPYFSVYQPIVDVRGKKVMGYEALIRGKGKFKNPEELFRQSYADGLTIALNLECLNTAFQILPSLPKGKRLFVNVEPITLARCFGSGREAEFLLRRFDTFNNNVVIEMTEGMKVRDFNLVKKSVSYLRRHHCQFAVDDVVGIGSKLLKILSLRPDYIKVGMALIRNVTQNKFQQNLIKQLTEIGNEIGSIMIAEGVERKEELDYVKHLGIHLIQGYYFSKPKKILPASVRGYT